MNLEIETVWYMIAFVGMILIGQGLANLLFQ